MKKMILALILMVILLLASTANSIEIKNNHNTNFLILTEEEYQSLNDDLYKLFDGVWIFNIGNKIENRDLKFTEESSIIPEELANGDKDIESKLSMYNIRMNKDYYPSVFTRKYYFNLVVDGNDIGQCLEIFTIGEDNICFGYRLNCSRFGEVPVYKKDPIKKLTEGGGGRQRVIDIELPSGEILKSVKVENYVQGLYISRIDEIFRSTYTQIGNDYESAMAKKPEIINKYKDAVGLGQYKLGMSIEEARIVDQQAKEAPYDVEKLKIYTSYGDIWFETKVYSSSNFRLYFDSDNKLVAVRKYLEKQEIQPTAEHIMKSYKGEIFKYNKPNEKHLPAINIIIGQNGDKARYMMDVSGLVAVSVVIYQPRLYDRAIEVLKERQQKEVEKSKSALE